MVYSDLQTKHFYIVAGSAGIAKKTLANTNKFRMNIHEGGNAVSTASNITTTTDVIDKDLIRDIRVSKPKGVATRSWAFTISSVTANKRYALYFYVENLFGFGLQDRWDNVISYTPASDTASDFYKGIACDFYNKVCAAGPICKDFEIYVNSSNGYIKVTSGNPDDIKYSGSSATATGIKIAETAVSVSDLDIRMHNFPYKYDVVVSSSYGDNNDPWIYQSTATVREAAPTMSYGHNGVVIADMEHYFNRNREDLYDLTPDFYTSIINKAYANLSGDYAVVDVAFAHKDDGSYDYSSEKSLTIATTGTAANVDDIAASTAYVPGDVIKYDSKYWLVTNGFTSAASDPAVTTDNAKDLGTDIALADAYQIAAMFK